MKLKNKLIPLASVAAVCTAATTFALTSCGTNTSDNFVDLTKAYVNKYDMFTPSLKEAKMNNFEATSFYSSKLATEDFSDLFIDDFFWTLSNMSSMAAWLQKARATNFDAKSFTLWVTLPDQEDEIEIPLMIVSFDAEIKFEAFGEVNAVNLLDDISYAFEQWGIEYSSGLTEVNGSIHFKATHIPFWVNWNSEGEGGWIIKPSTFEFGPTRDSKVSFPSPFIIPPTTTPYNDAAKDEIAQALYDAYSGSDDEAGQGYADWSLGLSCDINMNYGEEHSSNFSDDEDFNAASLKGASGTKARSIIKGIMVSLEAGSHYMMKVAANFEQE